MRETLAIEVTDELLGYLSAFGEIDVNWPDHAALERFIYEAIQIGALIRAQNESVRRFNEEVGEILELPHAELLRWLKRAAGPIPDDAVPTDPLKRRRVQIDKHPGTKTFSKRAV